MTSTVELSRCPRRGLTEWFAQIPGSLVLDAEVELFSRTLPNLFGYHLVQIGQLGEVDMIGASRILNRIIIDIDDAKSECVYPRIRAHASALPIESDSIDVVVLPHVLEFEQTPHEALREAQRVLVPEGHIVIAGFSPWSLMGVWRQLFYRTQLAPWSGFFLGLSRLKDWLALLGFDVMKVESLCFRPPFKNHRVMERLGGIERLCEKYAGSFGAGAYVLVGKKRVSTLTRIKPKWSTRRRLVSVEIVEPTARVTSTQPPALRVLGGARLKTGGS